MDRSERSGGGGASFDYLLIYARFLHDLRTIYARINIIFIIFADFEQKAGEYCQIKENRAGEFCPAPGKILKKQKCRPENLICREWPRKNAPGSISGKISPGSKVRPPHRKIRPPEPPAPLPPRPCRRRPGSSSAADRPERTTNRCKPPEAAPERPGPDRLPQIAHAARIAGADPQRPRPGRREETPRPEPPTLDSLPRSQAAPAPTPEGPPPAHAGQAERNRPTPGPADRRPGSIH